MKRTINTKQNGEAKPKRRERHGFFMPSVETARLCLEAQRKQSARKPKTPDMDAKTTTFIGTINVLKDDLACNGMIREIQKRDDKMKFVPVLIDLLKKSIVSSVRKSAAVVLGDIGSKEAKAPLKRASLNDDDESVRKAAQHAFEKVNCVALLSTIFGQPLELSPEKNQLLMKLQTALRKSWDVNTSSDPERWSKENPADGPMENPEWGQCAVTALIVNDYLGGKIVWAEAKPLGANSISHYFNEVDGVEIDLTKSQFPLYTSIPKGVDKKKEFATTREYVLSYEATRKRYHKLKRRVDKMMKSAA